MPRDDRSFADKCADLSAHIQNIGTKGQLEPAELEELSRLANDVRVPIEKAALNGLGISTERVAVATVVGAEAFILCADPDLQKELLQALHHHAIALGMQYRKRLAGGA